MVGSKRAMAELGQSVPIICHVAVETTGTMLVGSEIGAALAAIEPLGMDLIGLNCATGPAEMSEHLRYLSQHSRIPLSVMPNAGLPVLTADGAYFPLTPVELAEALERFVTEYGVGLVGGCCGTTPEHIRVLAERLHGVTAPAREPRHEAGVSSVYHPVPFAQDASVLMVGERTNANGSKAFREAMLAGDWQACVEIARSQARDGSHLLDLCVDYVGRDGTQDMRELAGRFATASTLPIMLDSTEPNVVEAGLEMLGGRCVVNSVNFEDGDGPESRYARVMPIVREHGAAVVALLIDEEGQARTQEWKVRVAARLIDDLTGRWGDGPRRHPDRRADLPDRHRAGGDPPRRHRDDRGDPGDLPPLPGCQLHPGHLEHLVRAQPGGPAGAQLGVPARVRAGRPDLGDRARQQDPADVEDPRRAARGRPGPGLRPAPRGVRPGAAFPGALRGRRRDQSPGPAGPQELAALPLDERLKRRIIDGERNGLEADLDEAMAGGRSPLSIINDILLDGMKVVGELFGSGQMQLPFVLQSAEVMKTAVAYLEPHMETAEDGGKGRIVLATVRGDVHDIGKNLVDIILSNNGYEVVNIGIKQPISAILDAAEQHRADAIGMSGLLVKSTVIMKENLAEMATRGVAERWPVLLGGAALTRAYVEDDLRSMFPGQVHYARDAFEGLSLMDRVMTAKRGGAAGDRPGAGGGARGPAGAPGTAALDGHRRRCRSCTTPRSAPTWPPTWRCPPRRSSAPGWSRACRWPTTRRCSTSGPPSSGSGGCAAPGAAADRPTRSWWRPRAGRGCGTGWTG